jgi:hypothetical protein
MNEKREATTDKTVKDDQELEQAVEAQARLASETDTTPEQKAKLDRELDDRTSKGGKLP